MISKTKLTTGTILASLGLFLAPAISAQENSSRFDEVIVTATKKGKGEDIQNVPLSITAFDGDLIEKTQLRTIQDVTYSAPNIALDSSGTVKGLSNFSIRGLGATSSVPGIDPTVGTFVDGVYIGTNYGVILDTFDLDSIEVLRGPQGLLFGRNVTGGAVVTNTRNATHDNSARIRLNVETGLQYSVAGSLNGSIIEDVLAAKVVGLFQRDEGFFTNIFNDNDDFGGDDTFLVRGALNFTPTSDLDVNLKLEVGSIQGDGFVNQNRAVADGFDVNVNVEGDTDLVWRSATLQADYTTDFGDGIVTTILGYRETDNTSIGELDGRPEDIFNLGFRLDQSQFSAETRYSGAFLDGRWETTAGLYYFTQDLIYRETRQLPNVITPGGLVPQGFDIDFGGNQGQNTFGIFTSNDFALTEALKLNAGIRYTFEEKDAQIASGQFGLASSCVFDSNDDCFNIDFDEDADFNNFSPRLGFQYEVNDDTQFYGSWSRGFRSGGFNLRTTTSPVTTDASAVDDEIQSAFELGLKGDFLNDRLRTNIALFHSDVNGLQRQITLTATTGTQLIENTADITIQGIEVEASYIVSDDLTVNGFIGILDSEFDEVLFDLTGDGIINDDDFDLELPLLAEVSAGASIDYRRDLGNGEIGLNASYGYRSEAESNDGNQPNTQQDERHIINASLAYTSQDGAWTASIYGKNLANQVLFQTVNVFNNITQSGTDGGAVSTPQKGRVIGAEVTYNF